MTERQRAIAGFLERAGWAGVPRARLAGDASERVYERLCRPDASSAVLMDAPSAAAVGPFTAMSAYLRAAGYSAPAILAEDAEAGLLLCEDLGDDLFARLALAGQDMTPLYEVAVDLLVDLHRRPPPDVPGYDHARLLEEVGRFAMWYIPAVTGHELAAEQRATFDAMWRVLLEQALLDDGVVVLRDYHAENLIWLPRRAGLGRIGLLDFQDAVIGPRAYDLVSLLEDARREVGTALGEAMLARYLAASAVEPSAFRRAYAILGAQRNAKIIGLFTRLWRREGEARYLGLIPWVWSLLERDLAHPALTPARQWIDQHVPRALRIVPPTGGPALAHAG